MSSQPETSRCNASEILDANLVAGRGDKVAIYCGADKVTYAEIFDRSCRMGRALRSLGIRREERVLLVLDDGPDFVAAFFGAIRIGAVPVLVSPLYRVNDLAYFIATSAARAIVVEAEKADQICEAIGPRLEPVSLILSTGGWPSTVGERMPDGALDFDELIAAHPGELSPVETQEDDPAFWLWSSGTTGRQKAIVHRQGSMARMAESCGRHGIGIQQEDVVFSASKVFHAYGLGNSVTNPFSVGAASVMSRGRPTPEGVLSTIERLRPTLFFSVPSFYNALVRHAESARRPDVASVQRWYSAAEALPVSLIERFDRQFGAELLDLAGSSEMLHGYLVNTPKKNRPGSNGLPIPGYELRIVDTDGRDCPTGTTGELWIKGPTSFSFYWRADDKTKRSFAGEWFRSGDRYHMDEDGFFWFEGRVDEMIKVAGSWVSPLSVEKVLAEHPCVSEAAVAGVVVDGLTRVQAAVVLAPGTVADESFEKDLRRWSRERFRHYQYAHLIDYPEIIQFVDVLPRTALGKLQRHRVGSLSK